MKRGLGDSALLRVDTIDSGREKKPSCLSPESPAMADHISRLRQRGESAAQERAERPFPQSAGGFGDDDGEVERHREHQIPRG